jgi:pimeloyl-ACP methyl ester carboxylesterase
MLITVMTGARVDRQLFDWLVSRKVAPLAARRLHQPATADWSPQ